MRIAVAGHGRLAVCLMRALLDSTHEIVAVIQNGRKTRGLRRWAKRLASGALRPNSSAMGLAVRHGIPAVWIDRMTEEELVPLKALGPDVILVGGFDIILKKPIIELPGIGCVNTHSSLLPRHRGPNPFSAAIMSGDSETGVTFHVLEEEIDTGDIVEQAAFPILPKDTGMTVYLNACDMAGTLVTGVMDRIEREGLNGTPQDQALASYDKRLVLEDSYIDWTRPAEEIERKWRAMKPFLLPRLRYRGHTVIVAHLSAEATEVEAEPGVLLRVKPVVRVATGLGTIALTSAYAAAPAPWAWPALWSRPKIGEKLE